MGRQQEPFSPFCQSDFSAMRELGPAKQNPDLVAKINALRTDLCELPEFQIEFFRKHVVRRMNMRGTDGLVFGRPRFGDKHWFLYNVGGDQDQVQLNIGMFPDYLRVGLGFMIGRQVAPKKPAFHVLQTFLGARPPLPFRDALHGCLLRNGFRLENNVNLSTPDEIIRGLETYVVEADAEPVLVFLGNLWRPLDAATKGVEAIRHVFSEVMPFYQELILASGRYEFHV